MTALTAPKALRSMQGTCTRPRDRVAGHAEVVLERDLGGVLDLGGLPPRTAQRPAAAIAEAEPTSPWQPTSAPEIEALCLDDAADGGGGQQKVADAVVARRRRMSRGNSASRPE